MRCRTLAVLVCLLCATFSFAQDHTGQVRGRVNDETGGTLPGVSVQLRPVRGAALETVTSASGEYLFDRVVPGRYQLSFALINFASLTRRDVDVSAGAAVVNVVLHLSLNADVTVTGRKTFTNLADVDNPAENLVGIAQAASQGAITAQQIEDRPLMRDGEVLENVPGMIVTQHSGEGKANQYFLRGFNLDHGTDFANTVAGMPANMPSNAHGQGYTDLNFMIPELVTGVQYSKGPYYADQGDFATAGAANINYANVLDRSIARVEGGGEGFGRVLLAASPPIGAGHLLAALDVGHNDGPWVHPDDYQKINGVLRYSQGDTLNGFSLTAMGYHGNWNSTDQIPARGVTEGLISRFGAIDPTDGGHSYRYSVSGDWQRSSGSTVTKVTAYGIGYDMHLFSDFTYFLVDPVHGDQMEQADHRFVSGVKVTHKRISTWAGHAVENTVGVQVRNDDITNLGLYHTEAQVRLGTESQDSVMETNGAAYAQNEVQWAPWLRTMVGLRVDEDRFRVADEVYSPNSGIRTQGLLSPKAGLIIGPFHKTEFYVDVGDGYHSNDARGTTLVRDAQGNPASPVTPMVRATGEEVGIRTVTVPHLQSTLSVWALHLDSELVFDGDIGTTEPSLPSQREGIEWANYYTPRRGLIVDADVSWSRARFTDGEYIPEAVGTVVSGGATVENIHGAFGSVRWRYFGPRALVSDNSVQSKATSLVNLEAGYRISSHVRLALDVFNLLNAHDDDIDYYYVSRLPGEPAAGIAGIELHPTLPRTARINVIVGL